MAKINFYTEACSFRLKNKTLHRKWISETIANEGFQLDELNFIFCTDEYLLEVNRNYLQHDYYTDVITFDNSEQQGSILGDIFISIDRVRDNARSLKQQSDTELDRVMVHGTLHLLGYKDKSTKDQKLMTQKEDYYLSKREH